MVNLNITLFDCDNYFNYRLSRLLTYASVTDHVICVKGLGDIVTEWRDYLDYENIYAFSEPKKKVIFKDCVINLENLIFDLPGKVIFDNCYIKLQRSVINKLSPDCKFINCKIGSVFFNKIDTSKISTEALILTTNFINNKL